MRRGLSLVETIFGGLLGCIVFFILLSLYPSALYNLRRGQDVVAASNLAAQSLEDMRATAFDALVPGTRDLPSVTVDTTKFTVTVTIESLRPDLKRIAARVRWDATGKAVGAGDLQVESRIYNFRAR